jgi:amino acid adenylation domain-containing protein
VHELIEQQAARTPDAPAVTTHDGTQLTYCELNTRADELACKLRHQKVGSEAPVGLFTEPSVEMLVGILGILKTGAAFVPLDPSSSAQYVALVLEDTGASVIVAQQLVSRVRTKRRDGLSVVPTRSGRSRRPESRRPDQARGQNIACVMHRADREGAPLSVTLTHRNLLQSIHGRMAVYREPIETLLLLPSFAADQALPAIFWTLSTGGRLVLIQGADRDPSMVGRMLSRCHVSHIMGTPSLYARVLESTTSRQLASLRAVIVGGEGRHASFGTRHRERAPHARLFAEYGRSECTFWSASCELSEVPDASRAIGRAVANTQLYVLDGNLEPVPVGVPGELYVGGDSVARGYLNRPALTRARFVRNVFSNASEACLFRTGDLVKYRYDGNLELLDRASSASHQKAEQAAAISNEEGLR